MSSTTRRLAFVTVALLLAAPARSAEASGDFSCPDGCPGNISNGREACHFVGVCHPTEGNTGRYLCDESGYQWVQICG